MSKKPNVLLIMTDQHHYRYLGCHGHPFLKTPNLDRLAQGGVDFRNSYAQSAICMPSRVTVFTGQYLHTHGIMSNSRQADVRSLTMLPGLLRENGYQTAAVGKTHAGSSREVGFDYFRVGAGGSADERNDYHDYLVENGLRTPDGNDKVTWGCDEYMKEYDCYVSDIPYRHSVEAWTGNECIRYLDQMDGEKPFFLWASFERPHAPTCVPCDNPFPYDPSLVELPEYDERWYMKPDVKRPGCENMWNVFNSGEAKLRETLANYCSLISMVDDQVGRILNKIEAMGELENTIVVFTADHGDFAGEFGQHGKNITTFDCLYHVPFLWYWKDHTGPENFYELVELVDLMPTVLELTGLPVPRTVQGISLAAALHGSNKRCGAPWDGKEAVFFENCFVKTVRTKTHKLSISHKGERNWGQLYDLFEDPQELKNLYDDPAYAQVQKDLERRLLHWFIDTQQPPIHGVGVEQTIPRSLRWYN